MAIALESAVRREDTGRQIGGAGDRRPMSRYRRGETLEFRLIYATALPAFIVAAVLERMLPAQWVKANRRQSPRASVMTDARHAANTCAAYALMG